MSLSDGVRFVRLLVSVSCFQDTRSKLRLRLKVTRRHAMSKHQGRATLSHTQRNSSVYVIMFHLYFVHTQSHTYTAFFYYKNKILFGVYDIWQGLIFQKVGTNFI